MSRKPTEPINVQAFVYINGKEVNLDDLSYAERQEIGTQLKIAFLNSFFAGRAKFTAKREET